VVNQTLINNFVDLRGQQPNLLSITHFLKRQQNISKLSREIGILNVLLLFSSLTNCSVMATSFYFYALTGCVFHPSVQIEEHVLDTKCRKNTVLSCHRCLINTGDENMNNIYL
jgi:hypothetical protein